MITIENYGYVPFPGFQFVIFLLIFLMILYPKTINNFLDKILGLENQPILQEDSEFEIAMKKLPEDLIESEGLLETASVVKDVVEETATTAYKDVKIFLKLLIILLPLFIMAYFDITYSSFSMRNLGVTKYIKNHELNTFLRIFGSYGIIQVLAQDVGIKTGKNQRDIIQKPVLQLLLYICTAYAITDNRSEAIMGAVLYFMLKGIYSEGKLSNVCFEDV